MKAAILTAPNQPLEVREIEWHDPDYGQVVVKVLSSGICGAQLQEWRGDKGTHFPRLLGHEASGIVIEVGRGVKRVRAGDKVVCHWRKGDGIESESPRWSLDGKDYTAGQITTFSTHSVVSENRLTPVPFDTPVELCALLGCGLSTALGTIENEANLQIGESVLIIGCGGLGLNLILAAKLRQAAFIAVTDIHRGKSASAVSMGADSFIPDDHIFDSGYDVIIDTSGAANAIERHLPLLAPSGRFILVGQPRKNVLITNPIHLFEGSGKTIIATQGGRFNPSQDIARYVAAWRRGLINLDGLITHRVALENINMGLDFVRQGLAGRVLVECEE